MTDASVKGTDTLHSNRQLLPNTGSSRARDGMTAEYRSLGTAGPWQAEPDVSGDTVSPKLYLVGPAVAELRPASAGLAAAVPPLFCVFDADGIAGLPAAGDPPDGVFVALESQGTKTWARVVLMSDALLYVRNGAVALAGGVTVKTDANGQPVVAAAGDQAAGITVRACDANKTATIRGARGKIA